MAPVDVLSIPNEILAQIFKDAVDSTVKDERALISLYITHSCHAFREIALDSPELWTCISRRNGRPGIALIDACLDRSKNLPLDVVVHCYVPRDTKSWSSWTAIDDLYLRSFPHRDRWRKLTMCVEWDKEGVSHPSQTNVTTQDATTNLLAKIPTGAQILEEFCFVDECRDDERKAEQKSERFCLGDPTFPLKWDTPQPSFLRVENFTSNSGATLKLLDKKRIIHRQKTLTAAWFQETTMNIAPLIYDLRSKRVMLDHLKSCFSQLRFRIPAFRRHHLYFPLRLPTPDLSSL